MADVVAELRSVADTHDSTGYLMEKAANEIERLRAALKEIAENTHDIEASACAWGALMRMKPRQHQHDAP